MSANKTTDAKRQPSNGQSRPGKKHAPQKNSSMRDKLAPIAPAVTRKMPNFGESGRPTNPNEWVRDGKDHIAISRHGATTLGRTMELDFKRTWHHNILGEFRSFNSFWFFLLAEKKNDSIRTMTGDTLRGHIKSHGGYRSSIPNFRTIILDGLWQYVQSFKTLAKLLADSNLPFDWYRTLKDSGLHVRFYDADWLVDGYAEIRRALKEGREPDFSSSINARHLDIVTVIYQVMMPTASAAAIEQAVKNYKARVQSKVEETKASLEIKAIDEHHPAPAVAEAENPAPVQEVATEVTQNADGGYTAHFGDSVTDGELAAPAVEQRVPFGMAVAEDDDGDIDYGSGVKIAGTLVAEEAAVN